MKRPSKRAPQGTLQLFSDPSRPQIGVESVQELLPTALPSLCQPGKYLIGGSYISDAILIETELLSDGTRIDLSYTVDQLRALLAPHVPAGYVDGDPILIPVWEAVKATNTQDTTLARFCDGMIRAGTGEAWEPVVIQPPSDL